MPEDEDKDGFIETFTRAWNDKWRELGTEFGSAAPYIIVIVGGIIVVAVIYSILH